MPSMLITAPILPERLDTWRRCCEAVVGEHREAYHRAIREGGLTRLRVWHHHAPDGTDHAVVLYEGPAPERFLTHIATASDPFATWFRAQLVEVHGLDLAAPPSPPTLVIDEELDAPIYSCSRGVVEDPPRWRRVVDELRPLRDAHGLLSEDIYVSADDEREFTVLLGWRSEEEARRYYAHSELRAGVERAGEIDGRGLHFLCRR